MVLLINKMIMHYFIYFLKFFFTHHVKHLEDMYFDFFFIHCISPFRCDWQIGTLIIFRFVNLCNRKEKMFTIVNKKMNFLAQSEFNVYSSSKSKTLHPRAAAKSSSVLIVGDALPFSILLIAAMLIPDFSDSSRVEQSFSFRFSQSNIFILCNSTPFQVLHTLYYKI